MKKTFIYEALTQNGESIKAIFKGTDNEFEKMLSKKKLLLVHLKEKKEKIDNSNFTNDDFLAFIEELYYLSNAGISIDYAIKMLIKTTKKESTRRILQELLSNIKSGEQLSVSLKKALKKEKIAVDDLSISFVSTAEKIGNLSNGLHQLFEYLAFQKKIRTDIKEALAYPIFLIVMSIVVSLLIFFLIIPKFATIFSSDEFEKLPVISYIVLSIGKYLNVHMGEALLVIALLILVSIVIYKKFSIPWMNLFYKIPKLSIIIVDLQLTIVYGALSTMIKGGLEIDKALKELQKVKLLPELNELLKATLFEIKRGQKLSEVFAVSSIIPASDIALLNVGESSASLDKVFKSLSIRHSESFNSSVKKLLSILEPAIIVGLGIFIAIIVMAIMMAVMSMTDIAG